MSRNKQAYTMFKRKPQNIYYVRYADDPNRTAHSTGQKRKDKALEYVLNELKIRGESRVSVLVTFEEFARDFFIEGKCFWLHEKKKKGKEKSKVIIQQHRGRLDHHIMPKFKSKRFSSITAKEVDFWLANVDRSNKTKNDILATMKIIWEEAKREGIVSENIILNIERYKADSQRPDIFSRKEVVKLFPQDLNQLMDIWNDLKFATLCLLLETTGLRVGEALALNWSDIVQEKDVAPYIPVTKALKKSEMTIGDTKNGEHRICFLLSQTLKLLNQWRKETNFSSPDDLIFPNLDGKLLQEGVVRDKMLKALDNAKIEPNERWLVVHSLRHTFNTHFRRHISDEELRQTTGHADKQMTDHYNDNSVLMTH